MENQPDVPVVYQAVWRAGGVVTPAIFLLQTEELRRLVVDARPRVIVTSPSFRDRVEEAAAGADGLERIVSAGPELDALAEGDPAPVPPRADADLAALIYTGGTTGRSKGVMLSHENLWLAGKAGHDHGYVPGCTRSLTSLPLSHAYGLLLLAVGMQAREPAASVLMRWFEPSAWLALAQEHRVQIAAVVPSMLQLLLAQPLEDHDLSSLRFVVSGAAPLPPEVATEFERRAARGLRAQREQRDRLRQPAGAGAPRLRRRPRRGHRGADRRAAGGAGRDLRPLADGDARLLERSRGDGGGDPRRLAAHRRRRRDRR
jgi:long-chain acyl-CoA synthetase